MRVIACRVFDELGTAVSRLVEMSVDELSPGNVLIRVEWSGINYKDALAVTGRGKIVRTFPTNAGSDGAGTVLTSRDPRFAVGDAVLVGGMTLGETRDGSYATHLRVPGDWVIPIPPSLTPRDAMIIGTAGFSAALAIHRCEVLGQHPDLGPIVVTGASGGVGSFAIAILAERGYRVIAVTGRPQHTAYLSGLGAHEVSTPEALNLGTRPLEQARFGGAVDNVGGALLSGLLRHIRPWGNVAAVGNAGGPGIDATVFPFILRGVSLIGGSSSNCPMPLRRELWQRLGLEVPVDVLARIVDRVVPLAGVLEAAARVLDRQVRGRILVDCQHSCG